MKIKVTKDNLKIAEKDLVHKGEYNVNTLEFEFSDDYTGISKMAVFTTPLVSTYEVPITNNTCIIPHEVLTQRGTLTIGVYGYTVENEVINKRYSPNPVTIPIDNGSYISGASNAQEQEPTLFEEFVQQIEAGFDEVADGITALDNSKQDKLTAGTNITIENNVISSTAEVNAIDKIKVNNVEQPIVNKAVNISVPTKTSDISNDSGFITKEVNNLTNYELKTDTGHSIDMTIDTDYVLSVSLKNSAGNVLNSKSVDLPLETMIVNGSYDSATKEVVLILDNGNEIRFSVADLVSGLQTEITSDNKLASDLVDDTNQTNKFVTEAEKATWNNKSDFTGNYEDLTNKPDLTQYEEKSNKTNELSGNSTQTQYPNAEIVYKWLDSITPSNEVSGENIHVEDSSNLPIKEFAMLGNATQADTPTPDTPQDIHVVTGDNTVKVLEKNLFSMDNGNYSNNGIGVSISSQKFTITGTATNPYSSVNMPIYVKLKQNTTYTISIQNITGSITDTSSTNTTVFRFFQVGSGITYKEIKPKYSQSLTFNSGDFAYFDQIRVVTNTGVAFTNYSFNIQIEENSSNTPYEPYTEQTQLLSLGSIELAKIGDYTDRIYKSGDKWYVEKNIDKLIFDGSEDEGWEFWSGNTFRSNIDRGLAHIGTFPQPLLCNYYTSSSTGAISTSADNTVWLSESTGYIRIKNTSLERNTPAINTWLSTHNTILYVPLATPTYTEITDTTLIAQLENVLKMHTNKNVTNAWIEPTGTNAQGGLTIEYCQDQKAINDDLQKQIDELKARVTLLE